MLQHAERAVPERRRVVLARQVEPAAAPRSDDRLTSLLHRAAHALTETFHAQLRPRGVPVPVWRVLAQLAETDGVGITELANACLFKQPTLTKVIDRMERLALVERRAAPDDRRKVLVFLTESGRRTVSDLTDRADAAERALLSGYSDDEVAGLKSALATLIERAGKRR